MSINSPAAVTQDAHKTCRQLVETALVSVSFAVRTIDGVHNLSELSMTDLQTISRDLHLAAGALSIIKMEKLAERSKQ